MTFDPYRSGLAGHLIRLSKSHAAVARELEMLAAYTLGTSTPLPAASTMDSEGEVAMMSQPLRVAWQGSATDDTDERRFLTAEYQVITTSKGTNSSRTWRIDLGLAGTMYRYQKGNSVHTPAGDPDTADLYNDCFSDGIFYSQTEGVDVVHNPNGHHWIDLITAGNTQKWIDRLIPWLRNLVTKGVDYTTTGSGYDGIFMDNMLPIDPSLISHDGNVGVYPANYTDDLWVAACATVLQAVTDEFQVAGANALGITGRAYTVLTNSYYGPTKSIYNYGMDMLAAGNGNADAIMFEGCFARSPTGNPWPSTARFVQHFKDFNRIATDFPGKVGYCLDYGAFSDVEHRTFTLACFLCAKSDASYIYRYHEDGISAVEDWDERDVDLGDPSGLAVVDEVTGVVQRYYASGFAAANGNVTTAQSLNVPAGERLVIAGGGAHPGGGSISWVPQAAGEVTLAAQTGIVIRNAT